MSEFERTERSAIFFLGMNRFYLFIIVNLFYVLPVKNNQDNEFCTVGDDACSKNMYLPKFILYDVNEPEGFNLKRDVYIRMATFVRELKRQGDFHLVLPPWYNYYHWRSTESEVGSQSNLPWHLFFDIPSLQRFAPVVEYTDFLKENNAEPIDYVFVLQHLSSNFETISDWTDGWTVESCHKETKVNVVRHKNIYKLKILGHNNVTANQVECVSFHGHSALLSQIVTNFTSKSILFHHAEVALHNNFGDAIYWQCRRSMRFAPKLVEIATEYRSKYLNSSNASDKTELPLDWRLEKPRRNAAGGPYLAVHLRRRDFLWGRPKDTPSIEGAAQQIKEKLNELNLNTVFVATDAAVSEFEELQSYLEEFSVLKYEPLVSMKKQLKDGGIAIIDQIICSYARHFIGSFESTFSFRIQEEREIIGFKKKTTFNRFCGDAQVSCTQPTRWTIVY